MCINTSYSTTLYYHHIVMFKANNKLDIVIYIYFFLFEKYLFEQSGCGSGEYNAEASNSREQISSESIPASTIYFIH